jgi:calcineurin-like phosphoesterase family protein
MRIFYKVGKVGVAGDWHGNTQWAQVTVKKIAEELKDEDEKIIFQLGDFGFWPGDWGKSYIRGLTTTLEEVGAELFFIDGNHENHPLLRKNAERHKILDKREPVPITGRITWLQRGTRATISGKEWLFLGGAASVDRQHRVEGQSWFPEERITDEQAGAAIAGGPAEVLVCHDSPAFVQIKFPEYPKWPVQDLALSQVNREKLEEVVRQVKVKYVMHGHMHMSFEALTEVNYMDGSTDDVRTNCFNCDGEYGNWGILDTVSMQWTGGG